MTRLTQRQVLLLLLLLLLPTPTSHLDTFLAGLAHHVLVATLVQRGTRGERPLLGRRGAGGSAAHRRL